MPPAFCAITASSPRNAGSWQPLPGMEEWSYRHYLTEADWADWAASYPDQILWRSAEYLRMLSLHPQDVETRALAVRRRPGAPPILLTVQHFELRPGEQIVKQPRDQDRSAPLVRRLAGLFRPRVLVIGQLLLSGPWGTDGLQRIPDTEAGDLLEAVAQLLTAEGNYHGVVLKDLAPASLPLTASLRARGFLELTPDPVMVMDLRPHPDFDQYLAALSSKYRVRYRRARKMIGDIRRKELGADEADRWLPLIYDLHRETRQGADFRFGALTPDYFVWLWRHARFQGYFDGAELVGFTTGVGAGETFFAHYLGLRDGYKYSHHLYHNMLFDLLADALAGGYSILDYGRTAMEIKSSLGAQPQDFPLFFKSSGPLLDRLLRAGLRYLYHPADWTERNPFK